MTEPDVSSPRTTAYLALSASAASTGSLQHILTRMPRLDGVAVIVALQHRDALDEEGFRRALAAAGLELADVRDDALIEAGRTYLIGADLVVDVHFKRQPELTPSRHEDLTPMPVSSPRRAWGWGR